MNTKENILEFFQNMSRINHILARKLEWPMNGISWTEFLILKNILESQNSKIRRIDLAENMWLTASGITRLLLPMEKIGLISREQNPTDKRASFVLLTESGKIKFYEAKNEVMYFFEKILPKNENFHLDEILTFIKNISEKI